MIGRQFSRSKTAARRESAEGIREPPRNVAQIVGYLPPKICSCSQTTDPFSLSTALKASDTGHLVYTTIHATNAGPGTAVGANRNLLRLREIMTFRQLALMVVDSIFAVCRLEVDAEPGEAGSRTAPISGAPGGVKRPPFTEEEPCRATSVPMKMWRGLTGSIAIAPTERPVATAVLPATSDHELPPSVDL